MNAHNGTITAGGRIRTPAARRTLGQSESRLALAVDALSDAAATLPAAVGVEPLAPRSPAEEVVAMLADASFVTDRAGEVQYANRASSRLLGHARAYGLGKPLAALVLAEEQPCFRERLAALQTQPGWWAQEWEQRLRPTRARQEVVADLRVAPRRDSAGVLVGLHWLLRDRTPERTAEIEAATREQALRDQVAQLTATTRVQAQLLGHAHGSLPLAGAAG